MTKLESISLHNPDHNQFPLMMPSIRIDWGNDRHQSIELRHLDPDSVKQALLDAAHLIAKEQQAGHL